MSCKVRRRSSLLLFLFMPFVFSCVSAPCLSAPTKTRKEKKKGASPLLLLCFLFPLRGQGQVQGKEPAGARAVVASEADAVAALAASHAALAAPTPPRRRHLRRRSQRRHPARRRRRHRRATDTVHHRCRRRRRRRRCRRRYRRWRFCCCCRFHFVWCYRSADAADPAPTRRRPPPAPTPPPSPCPRCPRTRPAAHPRSPPRQCLTTPYHTAPHPPHPPTPRPPAAHRENLAAAELQGRGARLYAATSTLRAHCRGAPVLPSLPPNTHVRARACRHV